ncbi:MAG: glycoside hydrolase family 2 TIM barrel-domain containing protein [Clostridiaceae bacterium]|nr:glycoside hydrolase family 2 TIM barrel-domain containing protein [Clostridiaceae bacterium]
MQANIYPGRVERPDWNNAELIQRERLPAHAYLVPFPDLSGCRHALSDNRRLLSPYLIDLSGAWDFRYYPDILQLPENILSFRSGFEQRQIPEERTSFISGQPTPEQRQNDYPFPVIPPWVPSEQPVLVYRRTCRLPLAWSGLRKRLVIHGLRSAGHIFVNGRLYGYTQGSGLPAEFDLSTAFHDGDNELFVLVYPFSAGSYFEQSAGQPAGIIRDIYLEAVPAVSLYDVRLQTIPGPEADAWQLDLDLQLVSSRIALDQPVVRASLYLGDECLQEGCWAVELRPADKAVYAPPIQTAGSLAVNFLVSGIMPWNDEQPNLYDLYIHVEDRNGRDLVCVHQAVGFRALTGSGRDLQINGKPLQMRAVSWRTAHEPEWSPANLGPVIRYLRLLKQCHLNTLYFRDEPPDPIMLELCDIYGFYVIESIPVEHVDASVLDAFGQSGQELPVRLAMDRIERLIRRDFNHACLIMWSAGFLLHADLETTAWQNTLAEQIRRLDKTRWLQGRDCPDCAARLDQWLQPDPEREFWRGSAAYPEPEQPGGCLYDLSQEPSLLKALKQVLRPLDIQPVDILAGTFLLRNRLSWTSAACYQISWQLMRQGKPILSGELDGIRADPGTDQMIELVYGEQDFLDGADYVLGFTVDQAEPSLWADEGDEIFRQEFRLAAGDVPEASSGGHGGGRLRLESDRHHLIISGSRFWLVFNRVTGALESWRSGEKEFVAPLYSGHPGGTQAGRPAGFYCSLQRLYEPADHSDVLYWQKKGLDRLWTQIRSVQDGCDGQNAIVDFEADLGAAGLPASCRLVLRYEIHAAGDVQLYACLSPVGEETLFLPCFSMCLNLKKTFGLFNWYGSGPERNQIRLETTGRTGLYEMPAADLLRTGRDPGLFTHLRWLTFKDESGFGLSIRSDQLFAFNLRQPGVPGLRAASADLPYDMPAPILQLFHQPGADSRSGVGGIILREPVKMTLMMRPIVSGERI